MRNFLIVSILLFSVAWPVDPGTEEPAAEKPTATTIVINPDKTYQTIDGFGASDAWRTQFVGKNWPLEKREAMADLLFSQEVDNEGNPKGIGLSMWRFYIGAGSTEQGEDSGITNEWRRAPSFLDAEGNWDWSKYEGQRWFLNAAKKRGVDQFLAFTISPPVFMTKNGKAFSASGKALNIQEDKMDDYADFLVEIMDHFQSSEGITFDYLSPINEPQWDWETGKQEGTGATNTEMHDFTKLISERLAERGLSTEITLGEAGRLKFLNGKTEKPERDDQIRAFFDPESELYVGDYPNVKPIISGHSYYSVWPVDTLVSEREKLSSRLEEINPDLGYWHSEYCILKPNDDITGGGSRDLGINTALYVARIIHHDMTIPNAKSWQWWTALTQFDFKDGLIYLDDGGEGVSSLDDPQLESLKYDGNFHDSKLLWALGNYSRFVRPGMKRIAVENQAGPMQQVTGLMASAYLDEKRNEVAAVFVNYADEEKPVALDLGGRVPPDQQLETYTTSSEMDLQKQVVDAEFFVIPARSVVTAMIKI